MQEFRDIPRGFPSPGGAGLDKASKASRPDLGVYLWPGWAGGLGKPGCREWASGGPKCPEFCSEWPHAAGYRHLPPHPTTTLRAPAQGSSWGRRISAQRGVVVPGLPLESPPSWCPTSAVLPQGAGLYTLHHHGLLPPVVPAPLHQLAGPLVHHLPLPVPGPGHGKQVAPLPGAWTPGTPERAIGHCEVCVEGRG